MSFVFTEVLSTQSRASVASRLLPSVSIWPSRSLTMPRWASYP